MISPISHNLDEIYNIIIKKDYFNLINLKFEIPSRNLLWNSWNNTSKKKNLDKFKKNIINNTKIFSKSNYSNPNILIIKTFINKVTSILEKNGIKNFNKTLFILKEIIDYFLINDDFFNFQGKKSNMNSWKIYNYYTKLLLKIKKDFTL